MDEHHYTVGQLNSIISSVLTNHAQDLAPDQQQQLQGYAQQLNANPGYFQQNPQAMQSLFNAILSIAAPFIIGYGINHLMNRGQGGQAGGQAGGGIFGGQPGGQAGGGIFGGGGGQGGGGGLFGGGQAGGSIGSGLGGLIAAALPGIIGGLLGGAASNAIGGGSQGGGLFGGQPSGTPASPVGNTGGTETV